MRREDDKVELSALDSCLPTRLGLEVEEVVLLAAIEDVDLVHDEAAILANCQSFELLAD